MAINNGKTISTMMGGHSLRSLGFASVASEFLRLWRQRLFSRMSKQQSAASTCTKTTDTSLGTWSINHLAPNQKFYSTLGTGHEIIALLERR